MYYLADFAFEQISDKALLRIRDRAVMQQNNVKGKYRNKLDFTPKQSTILPTDSEVIKARKLKRNQALNDSNVTNLNKQLSGIVKDPTSKSSFQGVKVRNIGNKLERTGMKAFPNSQPKGKGFFKSAKKIGSSLIPYVPYVAPSALLGAGLIGVNKLRGKTWTGKDK